MQHPWVPVVLVLGIAVVVLLKAKDSADYWPVNLPS
jgi:hypothetical protein